MLGLCDEKLLFDESRKTFSNYDLADASHILRQQLFETAESDRFYDILLQQAPWRQRERKMYDKMVLDPRLTAWYSNNEGNKWTPELLYIKNKVESACGISFDSVLLNLYRDGRDSVSWHSDNEPLSGHQPIASVSFGQTRAFHLRHKFDKAIKPFSIPLTHGSFLLMSAAVQQFWEHHIPKTSKPIAPRINLTFRITR